MTDAFAGRAVAPVHRQGGFALVMVLAALVLIALVAGRFASRVDALRTQSLSLDEYANAKIEAASALNAGVYWITTRHGGPGGYGLFPQPQVRADGRPYAVGQGAELRVQDLRGLYPLNAVNRESFSRVLLKLEARPTMVDGLVDVLMDYQDTDNLKRLNGAEADDYRAVGLGAPRNDWLLAANELRNLPLWRDERELTERLLRLGSTSRDAAINPNTAPKALLQALLPQARPEQLELFETLRRSAPFDTGAAVLAATGLNLKGEDYMFHVSDRQRLIVWAPGMPHALQYNLVLVPGGTVSPWLIIDAQPEGRDKQSNGNTESATPFPLAITPVQP